MYSIALFQGNWVENTSLIADESLLQVFSDLFCSYCDMFTGTEVEGEQTD